MTRRLTVFLLMAVTGLLSAAAISLPQPLSSPVPNVVTLTAQNGTPGTEVTVTVALKNTDPVYAAEFNLPLADGVTFVAGSMTPAADRVGSMSSSASVNDGALKVFFYSTSLAAMPSSEGTWFSFRLKLGKEPAVLTLTPTVTLSDGQGRALDVTVQGGQLTIVAPKLALSTDHIDYDRVAIRSTWTQTFTVRNTGTAALHVSDIACSTSLLSVSEQTFTVAAGGEKEVSLNFSPTDRGPFDGTVTVTADGPDGVQALSVNAEPYSVNELHVGSAAGAAGSEVEVALTLNNMEPIIALQCSFELPEGVTYVENSLQTATRSAALQPTSFRDGDRLTFYLYSSSNAAITGNDGVVATFRLRLATTDGTYTLTPLNVVLGNRQLENMTSAVSAGTVTVQSGVLACAEVFDMGRLALPQTPDGSFVLHNDGSRPLTISRVTFDDEGYSIAESLPLTIAAGASAHLTIGLPSTAAGDYATTMHILSDDPQQHTREVAVAYSIYEPNTLTLKATIDADKKNVLVTVAMDNYSDIVGAQMTLHVPDALNAQPADLALATRCQGLSSMLTKVAEGEWMVALYSQNNTPVNLHEGDLFTLHFTSKKALTEEPAMVTVDDIILSNSTLQNVCSEPEVTAQIESAGLLGDVDGNGTVNVSDAVDLIDHYLKGTTDQLDPAIADLDGNGVINVSDAVEIIEKYLHNN